MTRTVIAVLYAACIAGAVLLAPAGVALAHLLAFAFVVWLGGVTFTALWQSLDPR